MFASCQLFFFDIKGKRWGNRLFSEKNALILQNEVIKVSQVKEGKKGVMMGSYDGELWWEVMMGSYDKPIPVNNQ